MASDDQEGYCSSNSDEAYILPFRKTSDDESFYNDSGDEYDFEGISKRPFRNSIGEEYTYCNLDHFYQIRNDDLYLV